MAQKLSRRNKTIIAVLLLVISLTHCFFSIDWDEEYTMLVAGQIAQGYKMFRDIWSSHQTSAVFLAPLIALWRFFFGNYGLIAGVRVLSVFAVFAISIIIWRVLRRFLDDTVAFLISMTFFLLLPRGTISLEYGLLHMCFVSLSLAFLLASFHTEQNSVFLVFSGVAWSGAVLCYPFLSMVTPVLLIGILLFQKQKRWYACAVFAVTCALCGASFMIAVLSDTSLKVFLSSLKTIFSDPRHSGGFLSRIRFSTTIDVIKKLTVLIAGCAIFFVSMYFALFKANKSREKSCIRIICIMAPLAAYTIVMLAGNLTGLYRTGCMGIAVAYALFFLVSLVAAIRRRSQIEAWICIFGFAVYAATFIQGNLTFKDYFNYLYIPLFLLIYQIWNEMDVSSCIAYLRKLFAFVMAAFVCSLLYTKAFCVRIDGVGYSTVFEDRRLTSGSLYRGVYLWPDQGDSFRKKEQIISQNTGKDNMILLVDANVSLNLAANGSYIFVCALDGNAGDIDNDPRWIQYMDEHSLSDVIFIDKAAYPNWNSFIKGPTGRFLLDKKQNVSVSDTEMYHIVRIG